MAWRYEFYFLVVRDNILLAALIRKILFLPLENKIHIFAPPCNILYITVIDLNSQGSFKCEIFMPLTWNFKNQFFHCMITKKLEVLYERIPTLATIFVSMET